MKKKHSKATEPKILQSIECLGEYRGAFAELARRSGKSKQYVSKWTKGSFRSELLAELAASLCKEIREMGGLTVFVAKSSARDVVTRLRGHKDR